MNEKHSILIDKLIDNIFEVAENDGDFLNEIVMDKIKEQRKRTESGINKIASLISSAKLELGKQRHIKTDKIFNLLSKLNESQFIQTVTTFNSSASPQLALQFYRKFSGSTDRETIKEDSLLIELIDNIVDIDSFEIYINEQ